MNLSAIPIDLRDRAPDLARRLGAILLGLAVVIARGFLTNPRMVGIIVPLWRRLTRIAGRFERAVLRPAKVRAARPRPGPGGNATAVALPNGRGWLVRELGYEAAGFGSQLAHFLAEPEMQALIAAVPGVGLVLRPVCRMLGYELATVTQMVPPLAVDAGIVPLSPGAGSAQAPPVLPSVSVTDNGVVLVGITGNCSDFATSA